MADFYTSFDVMTVIDVLKMTLEFLNLNWNMAGRPTLCLYLTERRLKWVCNRLATFLCAGSIFGFIVLGQMELGSTFPSTLLGQMELGSTFPSTLLGQMELGSTFPSTLLGQMELGSTLPSTLLGQIELGSVVIGCVC